MHRKFRTLPRGCYGLGLITLMAAMLAGEAAAQLLERQALSLAEAKKIAAAAEAEALTNAWNVVIAIVDEGGNLIYLQRLDEAQIGSIDIAVGKARTAALFKRPTKALEDAVATGRTVLVAVANMTPLEGGVPLMHEGQVIGAIGVSGVTSQQDAQIAQAGANALLK